MNDTTAAKIRAVLEAGKPTGDDIAYLLTLRGYSQTKLAQELGLKKSTVHTVIYGRESSWNVATKVAEILDTTVNSLWPDRYVRPPKAAALHAVSSRRAAA